MDNKAIETLSVNAVKNSIVTSDFLDQFINDNDKEPSWDGAIYIYDNKSKKKSNFVGRMPVQIKGKESNDFSKDSITFSMKTVDLRNYLKDSGCVLFVVYIGNNGLASKIYYAELTPIKLRALLEDAKDKENKTVELKEFPTDNNEKATIFLNCFQNCQKQASFKDGKLFKLEELEKQNLLENIVIPVAGVGITNPDIALIENEVYLYANIKGMPGLQPIDVIPKNIQTKQTRNAVVAVDGKIFYTNYQIIKNKNGITVCYGESLTMRFGKKRQSCKIKYRNSDKIRVLVKDLDFMLTYLENGYFMVDDNKIPFDYTDIDNKHFDIENEKELLNHAKKVVKVLDILGCSEDIDIKDMKKRDWTHLNYLITAFLDKKPVKGLKDELPSIVNLKVGKLKFAVYLKACAKKGTYDIYDFFTTEIPVVIKDESDDIMLPVSQFNILHTNDFITLNNIKFEKLLPSFQKTEHHHETFSRANFFLLDMLNAYDIAQGERKEKILKTCKDFSEWIFEAPNEEIDDQVKILNELQIIKRTRNFNPNEIEKLYKMIENSETREDCLIGAYLLLGQQQAAEMHFARLSKSEQNNFKEYPIYHFWKDKKN